MKNIFWNNCINIFYPTKRTRRKLNLSSLLPFNEFVILLLFYIMKKLLYSFKWIPWLDRYQFFFTGWWAWHGSWYCNICKPSSCKAFSARAWDLLLLACSYISHWSEKIQRGMVYIMFACLHTLILLWNYVFLFYFRLKHVPQQALHAWRTLIGELLMF